MGISSELISSGFSPRDDSGEPSGAVISLTFNISSWRDFNSSSDACLFSVSSPYIGIISKRE